MKKVQWVEKMLLLAIALFLMTNNALATENGGSIYPNGTENFLAGAMPPPGFYTLLYGDQYHSHTLRDNNGDQVPVDFMLNVQALATRFIWVTKLKVLGGDFALHTIIPLVNLDVQIGSNRDTRCGIGDVTFGPGLGYHPTKNFHYVFAIDTNSPTGSYDKTRLANTGRNYFNIEPLAIATYEQPVGINADLKVMYDFNFKNTATDYSSGQELHADYAVGWGIGNGFVFGIGGYAYQQTTNDTQNGSTVPNNKGRTYAIGPNMKYDNGKGWFVTVKYVDEFEVRNRADGQQLQFKMSIPF